MRKSPNEGVAMKVGDKIKYVADGYPMSGVVTKVLKPGKLQVKGKSTTSKLGKELTSVVVQSGKDWVAESLQERDLDGTGPAGKGPRTGRGLGKCKSKTEAEDLIDEVVSGHDPREALDGLFSRK